MLMRSRLPWLVSRIVNVAPAGAAVRAFTPLRRASETR
jgi:hypothetical protein